MASFKERCKLLTFRSHGELGDPDIATAAKYMEEIKEKLQLHAFCDIYNVYECGPRYRMPPDRIVSTCALPGKNKPMERFTIRNCTNVDGSDKFKPTLIRTAAKPRPINGWSGSELGLHHYSNIKAWIRSDFFWLVYQIKQSYRKIIRLKGYRFAGYL